MTERNFTPKVRSNVLLGTAFAALFAGAVVGGASISNLPAFAQAVPETPVEHAAVPDFADLVEKVSPAVVSVRVRERAEAAPASDRRSFEFNMPFDDMPEGSPLERFFREFRDQMPNQQAPRRSMGLGSGFIVSADGYIVTNNHVVDGATTFTVILQDGSEHNASLVGKDEKTDLAVLKVDADEDLPYVRFAKDKVRVGEWAVAVGNPFGLGGTVTAGIVSASGRHIGSGPYDDYIQIDAAVNRGNSGGPTFNLKGEVIGVNSAIFSPSGGNVGIAFAIPAQTAEMIVAKLQEDGTIVRGWLGIQIQPVSEAIAESLGLDKTDGALVVEPQSGSPAEQAGIKAGDTILAVEGEPVEDPRDLALRIANYEPGTTVKVTLWRDGAEQSVDVKLGKMPGEEQQASAAEPAPAASTASLEGLGMELAPAENQEGVMISRIEPDSEADQSGLTTGDIILAVGKTAVKEPEEVEKAVDAARQEGKKAVLFRIRSGENTRFIALAFDKA